MERYDYRLAVLVDVREYIRNEINLGDWIGRRDELQEHLDEALWVDDGVTGNASGSYTFNTWKAEEYLAHNWDLLADALEEFGQDGTDVLRQGAEAMDVTIRCYLLGECISEALDELEDELEPEEEPDEEDADANKPA